MPVAYLDVPSGLTASVKAQLVKEVAESGHAAYPIPDTRVYLREFTADQTSIEACSPPRSDRYVISSCRLGCPPTVSGCSYRA
jgi:hypothetical protein